ncbi:MAG: SusC/RagA family TonB-linked outer membrane protein [Balneolaceae bacterium]|nr:SusC/RagA family TonB-linked outer membrane protein [Balneolaceae bacterium]MCH8548723.1 SusC/RagA family TonB-linked outer membrane protein [Balneolaceae bacterium]
MKTYILLSMTFALIALGNTGPATAQSLTVSGQVIEAGTGDPLTGVTIQVEGTTRGESTDANGNYSINLNEGEEVLLFSFIGYRQVRVRVDGRETINVEMEPEVAMLEDLVVTALGLDADQRSLGYGIQSVRAQDLADTRRVSVSDALAGQFSGVEVRSQAGVPGGSTSINIRGRSSLLGNNEPLYIVDGVPISNDFNSTVLSSSVDNSNRAVDLNPDDIESMTVLKGPAAAALYGIEAANGAIVITTKRGSQGSQPRTNINFTSRVGVTQVTQLPELQMMYGPGTGGNLGLTSAAHWGPAISELSYDGTTTGTSNWHIKGDPILRSNPNATGEQAEIYDNYDAFFTDGLSLTNQINIASGTRDRNFFFSYSDADENGFIPKTYFKRNAVRLNADLNLTDRLRFSGRSNYVNSQGRRAGRGSNFTSIMIPLTRTNPLMDLTYGTSDPANDEFAYVNPDGSARTHVGRSQADLGRSLTDAGRGPDSPFWSVNNNIYRDEVNRFIGNGLFIYSLLDNVELNYRLGIDTYSDRRRHNFTLGSSGGDGIRGRLFEENYTSRNINSDFFINTNYQVSDDLRLDLVLGQNYQNRVTHRLYISGRGFEQPTLFNISNTTETPIIQHSTRPLERVAVYGNLSLNFRDYLYLELTGRNEWSSTLPADANSFFYPAASLALVFTELIDIDESILSFGQLRLSYASVGNDAPLFSTSSFFVTSNAGQSYGGGASFPFLGVGGATASTSIGNSALRPESNTTLETGTDLRFFDNRVRLDFTYYYSNNKDQIIPATIPASSGYNSFLTNAGEMKNRGVEIQFRVSPVMRLNTRWDATFNFSANRNEVVALADGIDQILLGGVGPFGTGINPVLRPGEPFGVFYGIGWLRDENGNRIINADESSSTFGYPMRSAEPIRIGDPNPDFTLGWRNTVTHRNFRFTALVEYKQGGDVWNGTEAVMRQNGQSVETEKRGTTTVFSGVRSDNGQPNDITAEYNEFYWSNIEGYGNVNEPFVEDATWFRLRDVTLSYTLDNEFTRGIGLRNATLSFWGRNLLLITPFSGIDPETNLYGQNNSLGVDYYNNPGGRSFGLEISLSL